MRELVVLFVLPGLALFLPLLLFRKTGPKPALWFFLGLHFIYLVFVPVTDRWLGIDHFFGYKLPYFPAIDQEICTIYCLALLTFWLGYYLYSWVPFFRFLSRPNLDIEVRNADRLLTGIQLGMWLLIGINLYQSGISIPGLFNPGNQSEKDILFSAQLRYPAIDLLSNLLPVCLFLQYCFRPGFSWKWMVLLCIWVVFSLLGGWRYRIILFVLFMTFHFLSQHRIHWRNALALGLAIVVSMSWLTINRMALAKRQFHLVTFDVRQFDLGIFSTEFSNARTFRASLQYIKEKSIHHPGISSWGQFIANKFRPRHSFPSGERPKPWILDVTRAWIPPGWPWNPNPAVSQLEEFYLTFGLWGMSLGMFLVGLWVRFLDSLEGGRFLIAFRIVCIGLLFQWISRGFFLFQIQITLVCLLPFLVLILMGSYLSRDSAKNKVRSV